MSSFLIRRAGSADIAGSPSASFYKDETTKTAITKARKQQ